jgi:hypothetical protein
MQEGACHRAGWDRRQEEMVLQLLRPRAVAAGVAPKQGQAPAALAHSQNQAPLVKQY